MKNLQLSLKKQWFEMTKAGIKTEDYRQINDYWYVRLVNCENLRSLKKLSIALVVEVAKEQTEYNESIPVEFWENANKIFTGCFKPFDQNTMTLGYPPKNDKERIIKFEHTGIEIRTGNPEWGAEPGKYYFVIKHGKQIK